MSKIWDLIIVGAGPAGLSAAIYAGRDDLSVLVLEKATAGGNVASTEKLDNYPGFPDGISGLELSEKMKAQAEKCGAKVAFGEVTKLNLTGEIKELEIDGTDVLQAKSVLIATGTTYRRLDVPGEAEMFGRGVHFCATCDAAFYKDQRVVVIGGGNSAVEESAYIAKFAKEIDLIAIRELSATPAVQKEIEPLRQSGKIRVHEFEKTTEIVHENDQVVAVRTENTQTGDVTDWPADGVFVFVGQIPNTAWLADSGVELCPMNYVLEEKNQTNIPGVFVAGDVKAWAKQQAVVAAGDGVQAEIEIRQYLNSLD